MQLLRALENNYVLGIIQSAISVNKKPLFSSTPTPDQNTNMSHAVRVTNNENHAIFQKESKVQKPIKRSQGRLPFGGDTSSSAPSTSVLKQTAGSPFIGLGKGLHGLNRQKKKISVQQDEPLEASVDEWERDIEYVPHIRDPPLESTPDESYISMKDIDLQKIFQTKSSNFVFEDDSLLENRLDLRVSFPDNQDIRLPFEVDEFKTDSDDDDDTLPSFDDTPTKKYESSYTHTPLIHLGQAPKDEFPNLMSPVEELKERDLANLGLDSDELSALL